MTLKPVRRLTVLKGGMNAIPYSRSTAAEGTNQFLWLW